ncbi:MBOAT (membrane bound O-acyl transferase) family protein [Zostera marina]|uniref:MBOAT (Membrane bound O-acyl transferase) family protein n=1 Tax=Zostera marina TaxID=29655 RepID=A0A0K9NZK5_ZOSMR|nr:MBOAT (membrane bound O-acyl transferase) family protein [Zostera marina]
MEEELVSIAKVCVTTTLALAYCYFLISKLPPGKLRLISLVPVFYIFTQLPFIFASVHLRGISAFFLVWLAIFKLLLFSVSQGPLSNPDLSFPLFLALSSLPIKLELAPGEKGRRVEIQTSNRGPLARIIGYSLKTLTLGVIVSWYPQRHHQHRMLLLAVYGVHMYLILDLVLAFAALLPVPFLAGRKLQFEPQFSPPYLSTSLQDFWGRRWNLMVTRLLHSIVYVPVKAYFGHSAGTVSAFMVSGAMHEALFWYITSQRPTGECMCFFALHGACTALEIRVKKVLGREKGWRPLPTVVAAPLTLTFVIMTAQWLFFPQLLSSNVENWLIDESTMVLNAVRKMVGPLY